MDNKQIKEESRRALIDYWTGRIGQDFDDPSRSDPVWVEIRKILQGIREYDHDPSEGLEDITVTQETGVDGWWLIQYIDRDGFMGKTSQLVLSEKMMRVLAQRLRERGF